MAVVLERLLQGMPKALREAAFLAGDLPLARRVYQALRDRATLETDRLRAIDFLERIAWQSSQ